MTERRHDSAGMDPTELWNQWYETGSSMWSDVMRGSGENYVDPYGLYRQWFEGMQEFQNQVMSSAGTQSAGAGAGATDQQEMWRRWFEGSVESWQKMARLGTEMMDMTPRWIQAMEQARQNLMSAETFPQDPLEFAVQWYNATSGPVSEFMQDVIEREEFLEPASRFLQNYASLYKVYRRNSEEYLSNLQIPVRSDITRIASLIVALEEKVDRLEEAFEDFEYGYAEPATTREIGVLEQRIDRVEAKLDELLAAVKKISSNGDAAASGAGTTEIKATDAARRKADELGMDLSKIEGTGADGQITVGDVREKGES